MSTPFETLQARLGVDIINAYAVEHAIDRSDPAWAVSIPMLPVLDAIMAERERIEGAAANLPEALLQVSGEISQAIAERVQDGVVAAVAAYAGESIRAAISEDIQPIRDFAESVSQIIESDASTLASAAQALLSNHEIMLSTLVGTRRMLLWALALVLVVGFALGWLVR